MDTETVSNEDAITEYLLRINPTNPSENDALKKLNSIEHGILEKALWKIINSASRMRFRAIYAAFALELEDISAKIILLLSNKNTEQDLRFQICSLLGDLNIKEGLNALILSATQDDAPRVRMMAIHSLGKIGNKDVLSTLEWIIDNDKGQDVEGRRVSEIAELAFEEINNSLR